MPTQYINSPGALRGFNTEYLKRMKRALEQNGMATDEVDAELQRRASADLEIQETQSMVQDRQSRGLKREFDMGLGGMKFDQSERDRAYKAEQDTWKRGMAEQRESRAAADSRERALNMESLREHRKALKAAADARAEVTAGRAQSDAVYQADIRVRQTHAGLIRERNSYQQQLENLQARHAKLTGQLLDAQIPAESSTAQQARADINDMAEDIAALKGKMDVVDEALAANPVAPLAGSQPEPGTRPAPIQPSTRPEGQAPAPAGDVVSEEVEAFKRMARAGNQAAQTALRKRGIAW